MTKEKIIEHNNVCEIKLAIAASAPCTRPLETITKNMKTEINEIRETLKDTLESFLGPLKVRVDKLSNFEVNGTIEAPQGKKMVPGIYFSSIVPKEKDVRFYFYPAYTHPEEFEYVSDRLKKFKKGKSCFHVKFLDQELENEIQEMISKAIDVYKKEGWLE